jgi:hypothetical protein
VGQPILAAAGFQPAKARCEYSRVARKSRLACGWQPSSLVAISLSASHRLCNQAVPEVGLACGWQPSSLVAISLSASHRLCNQAVPEVGLKGGCGQDCPPYNKARQSFGHAQH